MKLQPWLADGINTHREWGYIQPCTAMKSRTRDIGPGSLHTTNRLIHGNHSFVWDEKKCQHTKCVVVIGGHGERWAL